MIHPPKITSHRSPAHRYSRDPRLNYWFVYAYHGYTFTRIYVHLLVEMRCAMTRWTLVVSEETDARLRAFLGNRGAKKGGLSQYVEQAVNRSLFEDTVKRVLVRPRLQKYIQPQEAQEMIRGYRQKRSSLPPILISLVPLTRMITRFWLSLSQAGPIMSCQGIRRICFYWEKRRASRLLPPARPWQ